MWLNHLLTLITIAILSSQFSCQMGGTSETGNARISGSIVVNDCDTSTVWVHLVNERFIPGDDTNEMVYKVAVNSQGEYHFDKVKLNNYYLYIKAREQNSLRGPISISVPDVELGKDTLHYTSEVSVYISDSSRYDFLFIKGVPEKYVISSGIVTLAGVPSGQINIIRVSGNYSQPLKDTTFLKDKITIDIKQMESLTISFNNAAPEFDELQKLSHTVNLDCYSIYQDTLLAHDADSDLIFYRLSDCPSNMHIDTSTGIFNWTVPDSLVNKEMSFSAIAIDKRGASRTITWSVSFKSNCRYTLNKPTMLSGPENGTVNISYVYSIDSLYLKVNGKYRLDWGDGIISEWSTSQLVFHTWKKTGPYNIRIQFQSKDGLSFSPWSEPLVMEITSTTYSFPSAAITPDVIHQGDTVTLNVNKCFCSDSSIANIEVDWGNGNIKSYSTSNTINFYNYQNDSIYFVSGRLTCNSGSPTYPGWFNIDSVFVTADTSVPSIILNGPDTIITFKETPFTDPGATVINRMTFDTITNHLLSPDTVNYHTIGKCTLSYAYNDSIGSDTITRTVFVVSQNTSLPTAKLNVINTLRLNDSTIVYTISADSLQSLVYSPLVRFSWGDGDTSDWSRILKSSHYFNVRDTYFVSVQYIDLTSCQFSKWSEYTTLASNIQVSDTMVDTVAPILTLNGGQSITVSTGSSFTDPGATAYDSVDGNITNSIVYTGTVDVTTTGTYHLQYTVSDSAGNQATSVRLVTVE